MYHFVSTSVLLSQNLHYWYLFRRDVLKKTQSSVIRTSVDLRQQRDLDQSQTTPKFDTWKGIVIYLSCKCIQ